MITRSRLVSSTPGSSVVITEPSDSMSSDSLNLRHEVQSHEPQQAPRGAEISGEGDPELTEILQNEQTETTTESLDPLAIPEGEETGIGVSNVEVDDELAHVRSAVARGHGVFHKSHAHLGTIVRFDNGPDVTVAQRRLEDTGRDVATEQEVLECGLAHYHGLWA